MKLGEGLPVPALVPLSHYIANESLELHGAEFENNCSSLTPSSYRQRKLNDLESQKLLEVTQLIMTKLELEPGSFCYQNNTLSAM